MTRKAYFTFLFMMISLMPFMGALQSVRAETTLLFLGDSLTAGFGLEREESFPSLVSTMLQEKGYKDVRIINGGISGSTSASALSRLKWYKKVGPDILFLALGANDGLRGLSIKAMEKNLDQTIETALDSGMTVILAGMEIPPNYGPDYTRKFREVFPSLAKKHDILLMPFLLREVAGIEKYNQADGIHPNAEGCRIVAANVFPHIIKALKIHTK